MDLESLHASLAAELASALQDTPTDIGDISDVTPDAPKQAPPSPTALKLDKWSKRRGKEWLENPDGLASKLIHGDDKQHVAADMLAAAWEPFPVLADQCENPRRQHFLASMMDTPEYRSLHRQTQLDDMASELAAASFSQQWVQLAQQQEPENDLDRDAQAMSYAKDALADAKEEVQNLSDTRDAMGLGDGSGNGGTMSVQEVRNLFNQIRHNHQLRRIMELAGRYRRLAQSLQHGKPTHGADEVVGIEFGNDLSKLVPSELTALGDEDLEYDFMRRFVEKSLLVRDLKAVESEARGPIVVVVDESGSMTGEPIAHAKAMALAMLWVAEHQKRWTCLVGFSGSEDGNFLVIPPGTRDTHSLVDWLEHFYSNGTDMDVPLDVLPSKWQSLGCPEGKTDIIQITDAICRVPSEMERKFNAWKAANQVRMNTIVIDSCSKDAGDLAKVSDRVWIASELNLETKGVAECLSV